MRSLSAKFRIALGEVGLLLSLLLGAALLGLVPDRLGAIREGRAMLAEAIAANSSALITRADLRRLEADLRLVVERNEDLLSAAVRRSSGKLLVTVGDHDRHWRTDANDHSTDTQLRVPIWAGQSRWGEVELRFSPLLPEGWLGQLHHPLVQLVGFMSVLGFAVFYLYLGKMLKHLDPSQAVPARVRSALDTMAEGLLVLDRGGHVVLANRAFATIMGKSAEGLLGYRASDFPWTTTGGDPLTPEAAPWTRALREGASQRNVTLRLALEAAGARTFMASCSPIFIAEKRVGGVLVSLDDITLLEEKEVELRRSRDEAEAANRAKSEFLANMSHEIRTPMNAILGFTEVLQRGYVKGEQEVNRHLGTIYSSGRHLLDLINDILDLSKVESGRFEVERTRCAPHAIVGEVVQILGIKAREKGISLRFDPQGRIPETVLSDPARVRQIVTNLVGNAMKFTEQGGVRVAIRLDETGDVGRLVIEVEDTGIGMSRDKLEQIFDPFVQADSSVTRRYGGTGLGLAISRRFARALGGEITVRSRVGEGSVFTVMLPTGPLQGVRMLEGSELLAYEETEPEAADEEWVFPAARVLVVDDGRENRELVTLVLDEAGLEVDSAENGQEGVERARAVQYDAILMDVQMPVMDGYAATRALRERGYEGPILALTAHAMKGIEEQARAAGYSGFMTKPIKIGQLLAELARWLGGERGRRTDPPRVPQADALAQVEASPASPRREKLAPIVSRLPVSNPRFRGIVERFIVRLHEQVAAMEEARRAGDLAQVAELAHWLKGAGGTVGLDVFTEPARELEMAAKAGRAEAVEAMVARLKGLSERVVLGDGEAVEGPIEVGPSPVMSDDEGPLVSRLAGSGPRLQAVIEKFVARLRVEMPALERAWAGRDREELRERAQWLKGAAGTVGFDPFTAPAEALELAAAGGSEAEIEALVAQLRGLARRVAVGEGGSARLGPAEVPQRGAAL